MSAGPRRVEAWFASDLVDRLVGRAPGRHVEVGARHRLAGGGSDEAHPLLPPSSNMRDGADNSRTAARFDRALTTSRGLPPSDPASSAPMSSAWSAVVGCRTPVCTSCCFGTGKPSGIRPWPHRPAPHPTSSNPPALPERVSCPAVLAGCVPRALLSPARLGECRSCRRSPVPSSSAAPELLVDDIKRSPDAGWPRAVARPRLPQIRACAIDALGSSNDGLAAQRHTLCTTRAGGRG